MRELEEQIKDCREQVFQLRNKREMKEQVRQLERKQDQLEEELSLLEQKKETNEIKLAVVGKMIVDVIRDQEDEIKFKLDDSTIMTIGDYEGYRVRCKINKPTD